MCVQCDVCVFKKVLLLVMCYGLLHFEIVFSSWYVVSTPKIMDVVYNRLKNKVDVVGFKYFVPTAQ